MDRKVTVNIENLSQAIKQLAPQLVQYDRENFQRTTVQHASSELIAPLIEERLANNLTLSDQLKHSSSIREKLESRLGTATQGAVDVIEAILGRAKIRHYIVAPKTLVLPSFNNGSWSGNLVIGHGNTAEQAVLEMRINAAYLDADTIRGSTVTLIRKPSKDDPFLATGYTLNR